jgi:hypothetical protein
MFWKLDLTSMIDWRSIRFFWSHRRSIWRSLITTFWLFIVNILFCHIILAYMGKWTLFTLSLHSLLISLSLLLLCSVLLWITWHNWSRWTLLWLDIIIFVSPTFIKMLIWQSIASQIPSIINYHLEVVIILNIYTHIVIVINKLL